MTMWTILNADGSVLYPCLFSDVHPSDPESGWAWQTTQQAVEIAAQPDPATHSWAGTAWAENVDWARERKWDEAKAYRDQRQAMGCSTPKGSMDTDTDSWIKLNGAVTMSQLLGSAFTIDWTMADNSIVTHNAAEIQAAGIAVGQFIAGCHAVGEQLRAQIYAATDMSAINIEGAPWPA